MRRMMLAAVLLLGPISFIGIAQGQLADSPWPMFHRDLMHTGRSPYAGPQMGTLAWSFETGYGIYSPPSIGPNGTIYAGSADSFLYAINSDGTLKGAFEAGASIGICCPAVNFDGTVYVGSVDRRFYAINSDMMLKWSYMTGPGFPETGIISSPFIRSDGAVCVGSRDNNVYLFTPAGGLEWSYITNGSIEASSAIASDGTIYAGSSDTRLYAFSAAGSLIWSYRAGLYLTHGDIDSGPSVAPSGVVYAGSRDTVLYAWNHTGAISWSYATGGQITSSPATSAEGVIYVGSADDRIYAIASNGTLEWSFRTEDIFWDSSPAVDSNGNVYMGSQDNIFYAINHAGVLMWTYSTGKWIYSSPAISSSGEIYVGSTDNSIYAFTNPTPTPFYVELRAKGGTDFNPGQKVELEWQTYEDRYGYTDAPCNIYLGVAMNPVKEDQPVTVKEIVSSGRLFLFDSKLRPSRYNPKAISPTYKNVRFPHPKLDSHGTLKFTVPRGAAGRWVFATAFIKKGDGFPAQPPVEVSNGFTLH